MKKRFIGTLLMGTLFLSSTSVFVSCKDYDDDINKNTSDIAALQTQLTTLQSALAEAKAEAAAAKAAADAANSSLDQKIANLLAQMEGADDETKAAIQKQIDDLKSNYATKTDLAAAEAAAEAKVAALEEIVNNLKSTSDTTAEGLKALQDQIAAIDLNLLTPEWREEVEDRLKSLEGANDICQKQIDIQRQVLNALIEALLGDENAAARAAVGAALAAIDEQGNLDAATLEALKKKMQTISEVVDEIAPEGNVITLFVDKKLKSLVFMPQTYYWGIEAAKITRLTPLPYKKFDPIDPWTMKELTTYIDKDSYRKEVVGDPQWTGQQNEAAVANAGYSVVEPLGRDVHDRYATGRAITVMLDAIAEYHVNPSNAVFDDNMKVNVISDNKSYTRTVGNATVSLLNNDWSVEKGVLSVPLDVEGTVSTVENEADGFTPNNTKSAVTTFAVQVQYGDTTVTSDYAAIVEETVKDLRLSHVPFKPAPRNATTDFIQTGVLNVHCGQCSLYTFAGNNMGMHLFATIGEVQDYVDRNETGQDLVNYQQDINLTKLVETHYTTSNNQHALFSGANFTRNFEYKFELTDFRYAKGNNTNESAHAAIYEKDGDYYLHPQDPAPAEGGELNGREYQGKDDKATEVVVDRVPLVRVSLVYKKTGDVVDYGYLPIKITKEKDPEKPKDYVYAGYKSDKDATIVSYNDCYYEGGAKVNAITTNWRQTEEDLLSHEVFKTTLGRALTRVEFEQHYTAMTNPNDLDQYYLTNEAKYLSGEEKPIVAPVETTPPIALAKAKIGEIAYIEENGMGAAGMGTSILTWNLSAVEVEKIAQAGLETVVRAIKLESDDRTIYPDIYVVFTSGKIAIENKTVEADLKVTAKRINEYWYTSGTFDAGADEIHTNVITPEENQNRGSMGAPYHLWKPDVFENTLQYVFEKNFTSEGFPKWMAFSGQSSTSPFNGNNVTLGIFFDDSNNGVIMKGYTSAGDPKEFRLSNTDGTEKSKKNLYATQVGTATTQLIASINEPNVWTGNATTEHLSDLRKVSVRLAETAFAKALLNYVDHELIGEPNVLNAVVAVLPIPHDENGNAKVPEVDPKTGKVEGAVRYDHDGITEYCPLYIKDYKFDVRFLRPVSISKLDETVIEDATAQTNEPQIIKLSDLVKGYTDFRGNEDDPNWKTLADNGLDYEEYYAPDGTNKFTVSVQGVRVGQLLSYNANVKTDLNKENRTPENEWVSLAQVSSQIIFEMKSLDEIEYRNVGATVQEFRIKIPVQVEYYWGTIYDDVIVTIQKTKANARQK